MYEPIRHDLHVLHVVGENREPSVGVEFEGIEVRRLRLWIDKCLRLEDSNIARELFKLLGEIVGEQGFQLGYADATNEGRTRNRAKQAGPFRDGYDHGFAQGMGDKADDQEGAS